MRKRVNLGLAGAVAVVAVWVSLSAAADSPGQERAASGGADGETSLEFVWHERKLKFVNVPPKDKAHGDFLWSVGTLYDSAHADVIGRYHFRCEVTALVTTLACEATWKLNGRGLLFTRNGLVVNGGEDDIGAVVGGTEEFIGATGQWEFDGGQEHDRDGRVEMILVD
jgi:hypothetical protein